MLYRFTYGHAAVCGHRRLTKHCHNFNGKLCAQFNEPRRMLGNAVLRHAILGELGWRAMFLSYFKWKELCHPCNQSLKKARRYLWYTMRQLRALPGQAPKPVAGRKSRSPTSPASA